MGLFPTLVIPPWYTITLHQGVSKQYIQPITILYVAFCTLMCSTLTVVNKKNLTAMDLQIISPLDNSDTISFAKVHMQWCQKEFCTLMCSTLTVVNKKNLTAMDLQIISPLDNSDTISFAKVHMQWCQKEFTPLKREKYFPPSGQLT